MKEKKTERSKWNSDLSPHNSPFSEFKQQSTPVNKRESTGGHYNAKQEQHFYDTVLILFLIDSCR